jgi:hypothetical protein
VQCNERRRSFVFDWTGERKGRKVAKKGRGKSRPALLSFVLRLRDSRYQSLALPWSARSVHSKSHQSTSTTFSPQLSGFLSLRKCRVPFSEGGKLQHDAPRRGTRHRGRNDRRVGCTYMPKDGEKERKRHKNRRTVFESATLSTHRCRCSFRKRRPFDVRGKRRML